MAGDVCFNGFVYRFGVGYCAQHRPKYIPTGRLIHYHFFFVFNSTEYDAEWNTWPRPTAFISNL